MATDAARSCAITLEESHNRPTIGFVFLPLQGRSDSVVRVFFKEPTGLQRICEAKMGGAATTDVAPVRGAHCDSCKGWCHLLTGTCSQGTVRMCTVQL